MVPLYVHTIVINIHVTFISYIFYIQIIYEAYLEITHGAICKLKQG